MNCIKKIWQFINKDVANANETKKVAVIMRLFSIIMCVYFVSQMIILGTAGYMQEMIVALLFCVVYAFLFYCCYLNNTKRVSILIQIVTFIWVIYGIKSFGWDLDIQNLILALLVLGLLSSYRGVKFKLAIAGIACACMVGLYEYSKIEKIQMPFSGKTAIMMQLGSVVVNMVLVTAMMLMFSYDSQKMEKKLVDYNEKIRKMASIDPLTGLKNRRAMMECLEELISGKNSERHQFSIAIGDIDFFKKINDTYGHDCGDEVLVALAEQLEQFMADKGTVARWGGEEFLLVFWGANGDDVFLKLEKLRAKVASIKVTHGDETISVTMTFGMDEYDPSQPIDHTISSADKKLYIGKKTGRNKVVF